MPRARRLSPVPVIDANARGVDRYFDLSGDLLSVAGFDGYFNNAFRHTPRGGHIELECREVGPDLEIRIGNSGPAIPAAARAEIFEKYRQATAQVGPMNVGLGLYFCRLAIEAQGGAIWVEETARLPTLFGIRSPRRVSGTTGSPVTASPPA